MAENKKPRKHPFMADENKWNEKRPDRDYPTFGEYMTGVDKPVNVADQKYRKQVQDEETARKKRKREDNNARANGGVIKTK